MLTIAAVILIAQDPNSVEGPLSILNVLVGYPMAGVLAWLLWDQIRERRATQAQTAALLERALPLFADAVKALQEATDIQRDTTERATRPVEVDATRAKIEELLDVLREQRKR